MKQGRWQFQRESIDRWYGAEAAETDTRTLFQRTLDERRGTRPTFDELMRGVIAERKGETTHDGAS